MCPELLQKPIVHNTAVDAQPPPCARLWGVELYYPSEPTSHFGPLAGAGSLH
jgi:hypothetical protein